MGRQNDFLGWFTTRDICQSVVFLNLVALLLVILAIDWDGVIHDRMHPIEGKRLGGPMPHAKEILYELRSRGHTIIIHSVVPSQVIADWMAYYDLPYDSIAKKVVADLYVDDKGHHFENWPDTLSAIIKLDGKTL